MIDLTTILTLAVALLASAVMAWVIGAGSSGATPFAAAVGANAISILRAALLVGILGFMGAALQGANVSTAIGSGLIGGMTLPATGAIVALTIGAGLMIIGILTGYPIATAFTVTGAVVGVGLAIGAAPAWEKYAQIVGVWLLTPPIGGGIAYGLATLLPREDVPEEASVAILAGLVGAVVANVPFGVLGPPEAAGTIATTLGVFLPGPPLAGRLAVMIAVAVAAAVFVGWDVRRDLQGGLRRFLLALGGLVAFSAGGSQVGLAIGPLVPLLGDYAVPLLVVLAGGGFGILVGSWTGAPRMIKALSQDYASLGPRRSIAALVPSFVVAQVAIVLGVPVSFNEIVVSAIVGSGVAVGGLDGTSTPKLAKTALVWVASLAGSFAVGYLAITAIASV